MHTTVIIPFFVQDDPTILSWTLEGFAAQQLSAGHTLEVLVGVDGGMANDLKFPPAPAEHFKIISFPRIGSAGVRNALAKQARSDSGLLVFANGDTRPDPDMVQCHADTLAKLPAGSMVVGSAPFERGPEPTVFDAIVDETSAVFSYASLKPETWHDFRAAYALNMSMRFEQFKASDGFPEQLRPRYYEDTVFAHRLMGLHQKIFYQPKARVLHRHPMTLDQYLDREEMLGIMAPVLARIAPETFAALLQTAAQPSQLAQRYSLWAMMDLPLHQEAYDHLRQWSALPTSRLGEGRAMTLSTLYQLHTYLKRLAFRVGFLRGMHLIDDTQWLLRQPQHLWRSAFNTLPPGAPR